MHIDKFSKKVYGGGYTPQCIVCGGGYWVLLGDSTGDTIVSTGGVIYTEVVVPTRVRAEATPFPNIFGEVSGRLRGSVPVGVPVTVSVQDRRL